MSKSLGSRIIADFADEDLDSLRNLDASHIGDELRRLSDDLSIGGTMDEESIADLIHIFLLEEVGTTVFELSLDLVIDIGDGDDFVLAGADHTIIEGLGMQNRGDSHLDIG